MVDYLQKGGPLMWIILGLSILATAVFLERLSYFHRATVQVGELLHGLANLIRRKNFAEALHECAGTSGPVARVLHAALLHHDGPRAELKEIVQEAAQLEVPNLERRLRMLATIAFIAPLLGLLGTVTGLIEAFAVISSQGGLATSTDLAAAIYTSLLTTAAGLGVAIPTAVGYSFLSARVNTFLRDMERGGIEIVNLLTERNRAADIIDFNARKPSAAADA